MATQIEVNVEMVRRLVDQFGGSLEKSAEVVRVGFVDEESGNVMSAFSADDEVVFNFAWRPHKPSPETNNYTAEGLFFC